MFSFPRSEMKSVCPPWWGSLKTISNDMVFWSTEASNKDLISIAFSTEVSKIEFDCFRICTDSPSQPSVAESTVLLRRRCLLYDLTEMFFWYGPVKVFTSKGGGLSTRTEPCWLFLLLVQFYHPVLSYIVGNCD